MYVGGIAFNKQQFQVKTDSFVNSYSLVWASAKCLVSMTKTADWFVYSIVQIIFFFWSFEISENILRNQKFIYV